MIPASSLPQNNILECKWKIFKLPLFKKLEKFLESFSTTIVDNYVVVN